MNLTQEHSNMNQSKKWQRWQDFSVALLCDLAACLIQSNLHMGSMVSTVYYACGSLSVLHIMLPIREHYYMTSRWTDLPDVPALCTFSGGWRDIGPVWQSKEKKKKTLHVPPLQCSACGRDWQERRWRLLSSSAVPIGWKVEVTSGALPIINDKHKSQDHLKIIIIMYDAILFFHILK